MTTIERIQVSTGIVSQVANVAAGETHPLTFNVVPGQIYVLSFIFDDTGSIGLYWQDSKNVVGNGMNFVDDAGNPLTALGSTGFTLILPGDVLLMVINEAPSAPVTIRITPIGY